VHRRIVDWLEVSVVMIEKRTVFVLGAGASCPYGFPTAGMLRSQILSHFQDQYLDFLCGAGEEIGATRTANGYPSLRDARHFLECFDLSSTKSIDLFLSRNPQFEKVGKMAICLSILHAEKDSSFREQVEKTEAERDWYFYLYDRLTREATGKEDYCQFAENRVTFVTFNYDRSLEHFLFTSLLHSFGGIDEQKTKDELNKRPVIHVYGKPAPLPWGQDNGQKVLPYARHIDNFASIDLLGIIDNIYVVHGQRANPNLERARKKIREAEHVFFLGFGYAKENLEALGIPGALRTEHYIRGTAMGATRGELIDIKSRLLGMGHMRQEILDCDCLHLLRECL
jgi:hypothetical protein